MEKSDWYVIIGIVIGTFLGAALILIIVAPTSVPEDSTVFLLYHAEDGEVLVGKYLPGDNGAKWELSNVYRSKGFVNDGDMLIWKLEPVRGGDVVVDLYKEIPSVKR